MLFALALTCTGALASGDRPPEGKEQPPEVAAACRDPKGDSPAGSAPGSGKAACDTAGRPADSTSSASKSGSARPDRFGTGYEARQGLGGGANRGGGGGGRGR